MLGKLGIGVVILGLLALGASVMGCVGASSRHGSDPGTKPASETISVATSVAEIRDMSIYATGVGTVAAFNTVIIRSRVDGQIVQLAFKEGQDVKAADLLAVIDPKPYQAALEQMQANLLKDQASLNDARAVLKRDQALYSENIVAKQQVETQGSMVEELQAAVRSDHAQVDTARVNLSYTRITSPMDARVGLRLVDAGNIVHASDPSGLIVLTQLRPISVVFILSEQSVPSIVGRLKQHGTIKVDAYTQDDRNKLGTGKLLTMDNQIDSVTGMAKFKAVFDNGDMTLWPNESVNIRVVLEDRKNSVVVPASAIYWESYRAFVCTMNQHRTIDLHPVTLGSTQGEVTVVKEGLSPGDVVIRNPLSDLRAGTHIEPRFRNAN